MVGMNEEVCESFATLSGSFTRQGSQVRNLLRPFRKSPSLFWKPSAAGFLVSVLGNSAAAQVTVQVTIERHVSFVRRALAVKNRVVWNADFVLDTNVLSRATDDRKYGELVNLLKRMT